VREPRRTIESSEKAATAARNEGGEANKSQTPTPTRNQNATARHNNPHCTSKVEHREGGEGRRWRRASEEPGLERTANPHRRHPRQPEKRRPGPGARDGMATHRSQTPIIPIHIRTIQHSPNTAAERNQAHNPSSPRRNQPPSIHCRNQHLHDLHSSTTIVPHRRHKVKKKELH